ncbi:carbohydrate ABC transporter permease [Streptomyces sp. YIM S03343]
MTRFSPGPSTAPVPSTTPLAPRPEGQSAPVAANDVTSLQPEKARKPKKAKSDRGHKPRRERQPVARTTRAVLTVVYGLPLLWIVLTSLKRQGDVLSSTFAFTPTLQAYRDALANPDLPYAVLQSAQISIGTVLVVLALGTPLAYALAQVRGHVAGVFLGLLIFLQMVPQTANVIPLFTVLNKLHLLDTTASLVVADSAMLLPWATLLLRPFFAAIPGEIEEAAMVDGAGRLRTFFSVELPMVRNGVATVGALIFLVAWGEFVYAINFLITPVNYPMSALIAQQTSGYGVNWPGLMALATLSSIPLLAVYTLSFRSLREGLSVGSVK